MVTNHEHRISDMREERNRDKGRSAKIPGSHVLLVILIELVIFFFL